MKIISWNIGGLGKLRKRRLIKETIVEAAPNVIILQETEREVINRRVIGSSAGIVIIWNNKVVKVVDTITGEFSVSIKIRASEEVGGGFQVAKVLIMQKRGKLLGGTSMLV